MDRVAHPPACVLVDFAVDRSGPEKARPDFAGAGASAIVDFGLAGYHCFALFRWSDLRRLLLYANHGVAADRTRPDDGHRLGIPVNRDRESRRAAADLTLSYVLCFGGHACTEFHQKCLFMLALSRVASVADFEATRRGAGQSMIHWP